MFISEDTFVHLHEAAEERQRRELEYRRIAQERDADTPPAARRGVRQLIHGFRHTEYPAPQRFSHP
jgi:hypothetical protein